MVYRSIEIKSEAGIPNHTANSIKGPVSGSPFGYAYQFGSNCQLLWHSMSSQSTLKVFFLMPVYQKERGPGLELVVDGFSVYLSMSIF